jgi:hypothetical protein
MISFLGKGTVFVICAVRLSGLDENVTYPPNSGFKVDAKVSRVGVQHTVAIQNKLPGLDAIHVFLATFRHLYCK